MSTRLLHIVCTPRGLASNTGRVSNAMLQEIETHDPDVDIRTIDLFNADLPAVAGTNIEAKYALMTGQALEDDARKSWRDIERNIALFLDADVYLLSVPMWNFGIPYVLKYYIDAIVQPGYLFRYDEQGVPHGLVNDRTMVVVTSRGADYSTGPLASLDFVEGYLRTVFGFVGITDMTFFNVQPMDVSRELRNAAITSACKQVREWVATGWPTAHPVN
ncbi:FMN-dependent NADH-azoreductase [Demequina lignilytica]|uniref:FMN dependent NADH:quinone oxidoreductase n=1 Tax=Demequina lignilytica TaxID=3051663 RepID=A0AB35ML85_9MICO|nr:NAD(P)H-dependent oxidoreductase [Demequina sp. SYSU T0a273]MDN4484502.1 NAD(P)H-dependent oxidoreductase [Demequina sp. SYSU T0a273]